MFPMNLNRTQRKGMPNLHTILLISTISISLSTLTVSAQEFVWTGACGSEWHLYCQEGICNENQPYYVNNWGQEACNNVPALPDFSDNIYVYSGDCHITDNSGNREALNINIGVAGSIVIHPTYWNRYLTLTGNYHVNDGDLILTADNYTAVIRIANDATVSGSGYFSLNNHIGSWLETDPGITLTNGPDHTIQGTGFVKGAIYNNGTIDANIPDFELQLTTNDKTNNNIMQGTNGGILKFDNIMVNQTANGRIIGDGGIVRLNGGVTITGSSLESINDGYIETIRASAGWNAFENLTITSGTQVNIIPNYWINYLYLQGTANTNNGTINVLDGNTAASQVEVATNLLLTGIGDLFLQRTAAGAFLNTSNEAVLTNDTSHTIHGYGLITANITNDGLISADQDSTTLQIQNKDITNNAMMTAVNHGNLEFTNIILNQAANGTILADGGSVKFSNSSNLSGGTLATVNDGSVFINNGGGVYSYFEDVTIADSSQVTILPDYWTSDLHLRGTSLINDGSIYVTDSGTASSSIEIDNDLLLTGTGDVFLQKYAAGASFNTVNDAILTNDAGHTLHGCGNITANIINNGLISADQESYNLQLQTIDITNNAWLEAVNNGSLVFSYMTVHQSASGNILADGASVLFSHSANVSGGTLETVNGGGIYTQNSGGVYNYFEDVTIADGAMITVLPDYWVSDLRLRGTYLDNNGTINITDSGTASALIYVENDLLITGTGDISVQQAGAGASLETINGATMTNDVGHMLSGYGKIIASIINNGTITANTFGGTLDVYPRDPVGIENNGIMRVEADSILRLNSAARYTQTVDGQTVVMGQLNLVTDSLSLDEGLLTGSGSINGSVVNAGATVNPGETTGMLTINGNFTQLPPAKTIIELNSIDNDSLHISGLATLEGTLEVSLVDGYFPNHGDTFEIMAYNSHSGEFTQKIMPTPAKRYKWNVHYNPNSITLEFIDRLQTKGNPVDKTPIDAQRVDG